MPSIAAFIQGLLSEDMYATGMIENMDQRISELNTGQLRLLVRFCETKVPGLTNKTVVDAYTKLLRTATVETDKRYEEEVRGERERLRQLKASHAGVNAKAWDTSHASLDRELAKFQKFLKSKARRVAEEEVMQEEMEKLQCQLLALPARRVAADDKRRFWWAIGATLVVIIGPIAVLCLLPVGAWVAVGSFLALCLLAAVCWFVGILRGIVVFPTLDDEVIESETRKKAKDKLNDYRAEVRRNYEATEQIFAADMKWRDDWAEDQKKERRKERRRIAKQHQDQPGNDVRTAPTEEHLPPDPSIGDPIAATDDRRFIQHSGVVVDGGERGKTSRLPPAVAGQADLEPLTAEGDGEGLAVSRSTEEAGGQRNDEAALSAPTLLPGQDSGLIGEVGLSGASTDEADSLQEKTRGPCQGFCLVENMERSEDKPLSAGGQPSAGAEAVGLQPSLGQGVHSGEAMGGTAAVSHGEETGEAAV